MKFIDFFSGIGGFHMGFEQTGHECVGWCEIDKFARKSYEVMYDTDGLWTATNIRDVAPEDLPDADIYTAGFPCQSFSLAGQRRGFEDTRGTLIFEILRLARERQPRILVLENVRGLLSHDGGKTFRTILSALDDCGYDAEWQVFDGSAYLPQNRERIYIVGLLRGRCAGEILPIRPSDSAIDGISEQKTHTLTARLHQSTGPGSYIAYKQPPQVMQIGTRTDYGGTPRNQDRVYNACGIAPTLPASRGGQTEGAHTPSVAIPFLTPDLLKKRQNGRRFKDDGDPMFTLTAQDIHGVCEGVYTNVSEKYNPGGLLEMSRSLKCSSNPIGVYDGLRIRKLTPREYFRLQGFCGYPPFDETPYERAAAVNSKTQLYKQAGNAVMVPITRAIGERIKECLS